MSNLRRCQREFFSMFVSDCWSFKAIAKRYRMLTEDVQWYVREEYLRRVPREMP